MRITLILGADGSPYAHDLAAQLEPGDELTVLAPTVRGHFSAGLQASPDLDALLTSPAAAPTHAVADALELVGYTPHWQRVSDQVMAVRLVRTDLQRAGASLTDATIAAAGRAGLPYRLLPMCEDRAEFRVVVGSDEDARAIHIGEYLDEPARHEPTQLLLIADQISCSSAVSEVLLATDVLVLGPSSRTLVIDPVLRTPGLLEMIADDLPVLVVDHDDAAPPDLVRAAGRRQDTPGNPVAVAADPSAAIELARGLVAR